MNLKLNYFSLLRVGLFLIFLQSMYAWFLVGRNQIVFLIVTVFFNSFFNCSKT